MPSCRRMGRRRDGRQAPLPASPFPHPPRRAPLPINAPTPQPLRGLTGNKPAVQTSGASLSAAIVQLEADYPGMKERLMDESGDLRRFVNVFVNGEDVR